MKAFILILIFSWIVTLFLPWWAMLFPAVAGGWFLNASFKAFAAGFLAVGLAWFLHAVYIHVANDGILSARIAEMMGAGSPWVILLITFLTGGIPGGFGALTGFLLKANMKSTNAPVQTQ